MQSALLLISQVYAPDPAAVGLYLADVSAGLVRRGYSVRVLTSDRGYDDPTFRYPRHEMRDGVCVERLRWSSTGKRSLVVRAMGMLSFLAQAGLRGLFMRNLGAVLVSSSPPMGAVVALAVARLRCVPLVYWVMDVNPDQAIAAGVVDAHTFSARWLERANRWVLDRANRVITLDRWMEQRLRRKADSGGRLVTISLWPLADHFQSLDHHANPFRQRHHLGDRFVVMHSGNHSLVHPLDTLLEAARRLREDPRIVFLLVGGGAARPTIARRVKEESLTNVRILPSEPAEGVHASLSAADVQIVAMGDAMVGCVHPSKFYAALSVHRPMILIGSPVGAIAEMVETHGCGWRVGHGEGVALAELFTRLSSPAGRLEIDEKTAGGQRALAGSLNRNALRERWFAQVESALGKP